MAINITPDSYTKFLVHSDTTNGSTTFVDSSATGHTVVTNGDPSHSTSQAKFGSTAIHCDASADGFGAAASSEFALGTQDWTLDFWWYPTSIESENYFLHTTGGWSMLCLYYPSNNGWKVIHNNPTSWQTSLQGGAGTLTVNEYQHIAFVRASNVFTIYLDGVIVAGPSTDTRALTNTNTTLAADGYMAGNVTGYIDEYRLSVGIARWTAAFTPPTKPYSITSPGSIMASNVEDDGSRNTSFGTNIITRSDPDEASTDSVFSVSAKDGTELLDVSAAGDVTINANDDGAIIIGSTARDDHAYFQNIHLTDTTTYDMYGFVNRHKSTGGAKNDTDHLVGITNSVEADNTAGFFGNIIGIQNTATLTNMVNNQGNNLYGMFNELVTQNNGNNDLRNIYGSYWLIDVNGKEIDTGVYGSYIDVDIESEATVGGNSYGQFIQMDDDAGDNNTLGIYLNLLSGVQWGYYQDEGGSATIKFSGGGNGYWDGAADNGAADYAEYFESSGSLVIPVGNTVVLENGEIRQSADGETPIGVIRPHDGCAVIGNSAWSKWQEKYLKDDYGTKIFESSTKTRWSEEITFEAYISGSLNSFDKTGGSEGGIITDDKVEPNGSESVKYYREYKHYTDRIPSGSTVPGDAVVFDSGQRQRLNPDYDPDREYEPREERDEWHIVGLLGQIPITKGQPTGSSWIKMKDVSDTVEMYFVK